MKKELTAAEVDRRFAEIDEREPEEPTAEDLAALVAAEAMDDGTTMTLDAFRKDLDAYSGKLVLRIPRSLHRKLKNEATMEGVSLNQYMLYKLAK